MERAKTQMTKKPRSIEIKQGLKHLHVCLFVDVPVAQKKIKKIPYWAIAEFGS
jgi:hypothetical protein